MQRCRSRYSVDIHKIFMLSILGIIDNPKSKVEDLMDDGKFVLGDDGDFGGGERCGGLELDVELYEVARGSDRCQ